MQALLFINRAIGRPLTSSPSLARGMPQHLVPSAIVDVGRCGHVDDREARPFVEGMECVGETLIAWMGGRVVEGTGLENQQGCKLLVGSNPTPSAIFYNSYHLTNCK